MKFLIIGVGDGVEDSAVGVTYSTKPNNPNVLLGTGHILIFILLGIWPNPHEYLNVHLN